MKKWRDKLFRNIHQNNLIYNTCWEDPYCDRQLMKFNKQSKIMMITSAGCNALDYLLDDPQSIDCVDLNFRQNALLALKVAFFRKGDFELLFQFFGNGCHPQAKRMYRIAVRPFLDEQFRPYWDKKISFFDGSGLRPSFYFKGTSGFLAWAFKKAIFLQPQLNRSIHKVIESIDIQEQIKAYQTVSQRLFNSQLSKLMAHPLALSLAGVPEAQSALFPESYQNTKGGYIKYSLDKVFYQLPIKENYFYSVYWKGKYDWNRCPSYLKEENFEILRDRVDRIHWHTSSITNFLSQSKKSYTHYVLLDHMDWLARHQPAELSLEWDQIFSASANEATVLFRSAALDIDWLPPKVLDRVVFDRKEAERVHQLDRVGTYASVWYGKIHTNE